MNPQDIGAIIIILCALPFLYWAFKDYFKLCEIRKQLNAEGLDKKDIENIKELIYNRKGN